ncbi:hypothetical protein CBR_g16081 [Chara braunii]|uniref:Integrase catalytic domain-containing protein n=1 Tax=Chara braunii TaxID=69332 RepID=A0A388KTI2_CHABU|nr:hypothetical protein CBR_g16081 [Chara braunii]|eukprot:GBG73367.1 hypothetical protein CBR_g16081 [Chara braunii]
MATEDETCNHESEGGPGLGGSAEQSKEGQKDRESTNPDGTKGNRKEMSSGESSGKAGGSRQGTQENKKRRNKDRASPGNSEGAVSKKVRVTDARHKLAEIEKRTAEYKARLMKEMMTGNEEGPLQEPGDAKKKLTFDGANITEFLIDYENLAALLKWTEEETMDHLGQHVSLSRGRDIMTIVAASRSWKETRDVMMRKYLAAEKMATEADLAAIQRKNFATYNDFLREFTLVALRIPVVTDQIMSKYFLRQFSEFDKDKILSAYQQTSKFVNTRDVDFSAVTNLAEKTVVTETLALLKEGDVIDLTSRTGDKEKKGIESLHERVHGVDNKIERMERALLVMQAQVSRPPLPPQEAVVPPGVANRGYGRRYPANEQCKYCTAVGHFVRACPTLNHDILKRRCTRSLKGEIFGPQGERVNRNSPGGMRRAIIMLNGLEITVVEAELVGEIIWDQLRGRGPQINFILENDGRDRVNTTTRLGTAGRRINRDTVMKEVAGSSEPQAEPEAEEPEKVYGKPREEEPTDKMQVTPMGFTNAVTEAQSRMHAVAGEMFPEKCKPYIDDNPIKGAQEKDETEVQPGIRKFVWDHIQDIEDLIRRFLVHNITASGPKSILAVPEVTILGFRCGAYGRKPDPAKTDKISQWRTPQRTTTEVRAFLGVFDYKIERIAGIRNKADWLSQVCITPKEVEGEEPIDAFLEYEGGNLAVDNEMMGEECASGELLIRTLEKGAPAVVAELIEGPVTTRGRKEEKDSWGSMVGPKEELIAMAVEGGREAVMSLVESWERKELQWVVNQMQEGKDGGQEGEEFFYVQSYEGLFREIGLLLVGNKQPTEVSIKVRKEAERYVLRGGHLFRREEGAMPRRTVCGKSRQVDVIKAMHDGLAGGHRSSKGTLAKITSLYYWPGMAGMVAIYCQTCLICQERSSVQVFKPLRPTRVLGSGHLIHLDLAVIPVSTDGYMYILDARDNLSGFVEAVALKKKTGRSVADWIEDFYLRHPFVRRFIVDNETEFMNQEVLGMLKRLRVPIKLIEPYHPEANAPVERGYRTLKNTIAKLAADHLGSWPKYLKQTVVAENMTPKRTTGCIPVELWYGREIDFPVEVLVPTWNRLDDDPQMTT